MLSWIEQSGFYPIYCGFWGIRLAFGKRHFPMTVDELDDLTQNNSRTEPKSEQRSASSLMWICVFGSLVPDIYYLSKTKACHFSHPNSVTLTLLIGMHVFTLKWKSMWERHNNSAFFFIETACMCTSSLWEVGHCKFLSTEAITP